MKKVCYFFAICLTSILAISCTSTPKVENDFGQVKVIDHKGARWGVDQPEWVKVVLATPNQKTLSKELGIDKHIWVLSKSGDNLDFIQTYVDQVDARAEIASSIKQGVADYVAAHMNGEEEEVERSVKRESARAEMITLSGLNKETSWWTKTRSRPEKKSDYIEEYNYMVIYSLDEKLYQKQIEAAYKDSDDLETIKQIFEYLSNQTWVELK